jgi:hydroxyacylglutathione hydrolase
VLGLHAAPVLISATDEQRDEARLRMARVGIEEVAGYLVGGVEAWKNAGLELASLRQIFVQELRNALNANSVKVLDVRREPEWQAGHVAGAQWYALDNFRQWLPEIDSTGPVAVHCKSGYRSMIASSILLRAGHTNVVNVVGGLDAWTQAGLPVETKAEAVAAKV